MRMKHGPVYAVMAMSAAVATLIGVTPVAGGAGTVTASASPSVASGATARSACAPAAPGYASCQALIRVDSAGHDLVTRGAGPSVNPSGYHPADIQKAYNLTSAVANGGTVAIVDVYDDPKAESDLQVYRNQFGLPKCTTANGCFTKLNQNGAKSPLPSGDTGWGAEISLDVDMVSATCPKCKIVLVEAFSNSFANLAAAVDTASAKAHIVSNSYSGGEFSGETSLESHYSHPGVIQTVATDDHGYAAGPQVPTTFKSVTAVGGTALHRANNPRGFTESAWSGAGSGCSFYLAKPSWQHDNACSKRMTADVSAVADPATGLSVYDTYGMGGWLVYGGTSAATPIVGAVYAMAGGAASQSNASFTYANVGRNLFDVTSGSNGSCGGTYRCTGKPGYDGPTGLGTPDGLGAFKDVTTRHVSVSYNASDANRIKQMATALKVSPSAVQKECVYIVSYILGHVPPGQTPVTAPGGGNAVTYHDTWAPNELSVIDRVDAQMVLNDVGGTHFAEKLVDYLLALGGK